MVPDINFNVNGKIEISWSDGFYKSNIEDVTNEYIAISIPIKGGQYIPLRVGEQLEVIYFHDKENIYKFYTVVRGRKIDTIPVILLEKPKTMYKFQRRRFVRVPVFSPINCYLENKDSMSNGKEDNNKLLVNASMVDISGGGMRVKMDCNVELGQIVTSHIKINSDEIVIKGEVVRIEKDQENRNICGLNFIDLDEKTRDKIVRYIFQLMRQQMRKV